MDDLLHAMVTRKQAHTVAHFAFDRRRVHRSLLANFDNFDNGNAYWMRTLDVPGLIFRQQHSQTLVSRRRLVLIGGEQYAFQSSNGIAAVDILPLDAPAQLRRYTLPASLAGGVAMTGGQETLGVTRHATGYDRQRERLVIVGGLGVYGE